MYKKYTSPLGYQNNANDDFFNDFQINTDGQEMAKSGNYQSSFEACEKYRPTDYSPLERLKYYKK